MSGKWQPQTIRKHRKLALDLQSAATQWNFSPAEVAKLLKVGPETVNRWFNGTHSGPTKGETVELAKAFVDAAAIGNTPAEVKAQYTLRQSSGAVVLPARVSKAYPAADNGEVAHPDSRLLYDLAKKLSLTEWWPVYRAINRPK